MHKKEQKRDLRERLLEKLLSLTKEELKRRSENVEQFLSDLPIYRNSKVIMGYYPIKGEVDVLGMLRKAYTKGKKVCFPVTDTRYKHLYPWEVTNFDDSFCRGPFCVKEPDTRKNKKVETQDIDIILVPGLGFDYSRNRLGRGKGFYDRFLKSVKPPTLKVGIAFDFQILESLPIHTQFDEKVDLIVSEKFLI